MADDHTDDTPDDVLMNEPTATFERHLFTREDVQDAGGEAGTKTNRPVASVCGRTTAYGEFEALPDMADHDIAELDLCDPCADRLANLLARTALERADYADLQSLAATTDGVPGSGISEDAMREQLVDVLGAHEAGRRLSEVVA